MSVCQNSDMIIFYQIFKVIIFWADLYQMMLLKIKRSMKHMCTVSTCCGLTPGCDITIIIPTFQIIHLNIMITDPIP